jgi:hypothetical protein
MKRLQLLIVLIVICTSAYCQPAHIYTTDIALYWQAYDRVQQTKDSTLQLNIIQHSYLDRGSAGLKEFAAIRKWTPEKFRRSIIAYPAYWASIRSRTEHMEEDIAGIDALLKGYAQLYPQFKMPDIYFIMGYAGTGGTTTQTKVLIGTEIAIADSTTDSRGMNPFLLAYFRQNKGVAQLVAHELTHTQQKGGDMEGHRNTNLLGLCIAEGVCDFIAELLLKHPVEAPYMGYGRVHEREIWQQFEREMSAKDITNWLYNGGMKKNGDADLGYFVGYAICKSYYEHAKDKKAAIRDMIQVDYERPDKLDDFLKRSGYGQQWN